MLREVAGIQKVQKLYLQLLYRCQFRCLHCFHGNNLARSESYSTTEAVDIFDFFIGNYGTHSVTLLGGEPFLNRDMPDIAAAAVKRGLRVEVCTNGFRVAAKLRRVAEHVHKIRVSLEGLRETNDLIRHHGSYDEAIRTLKLARELGISTGVTLTVTTLNAAEINDLADVLDDLGVGELKLHALRAVGYAATNDFLHLCEDSAELAESLARLVSRPGGRLSVLLDDDLDRNCSIVHGSRPRSRVIEELDRVEIQPSGELYLSCARLVGDLSNAFYWNRSTREVELLGATDTELDRRTPQVQYSRL